MFKKIIILLISLMSIQMFYSCSGAGVSKTKIYVENKFWSDSDSRVVTDSLVNKMLNSEWITNFKSNRKPRIVVGRVNNQSTKKTDSDLIEKNIERSFLNSGKVTFVSSKDKREEIRSNRKNSTDFINQKDFNKYLKALKSDFFINGNFELKIDSLESTISKKYILSIQVINSKDANAISTITLETIK